MRCAIFVRLRVAVSSTTVLRRGMCVRCVQPLLSLPLWLPGYWHSHCLYADIGPDAGTHTCRQINSPPQARLGAYSFA